ncbi:MAG: sialidase family protein [Chloroflexota bacterium]
MASNSLTKVARAATVAGLVVLFATQTAAAATPRVLATVSNPYAGCTIGSGPPDWETQVYVNGEVEPMVAVNPANRRNVIGVVQQDRWNDGGAHGLVAMWSKDGGQTFHVVPLPFSSCAPGGLNYERASDPWVSIGPDGTAYTVSISFDENTTRGAIGAATSTDGGKSWGNLVELATPDGFFDDKESVTADPTIPGTAYLLWDRLPYFGDWPGPAMMSKTTDFGVTWSDPVEITPPSTKTATLGNVLLVDPNNGTLYDFFDHFAQNSDKAKYMVIKSTDGGDTWSSPTLIAQDFGIQTVDPHHGGPDIRDGWEIISAAIDPNTGRLYAVWQDARYTNGSLNQVLISSSANGNNWTHPFVVSRTIGQAAFTGTVAVNGAGQVGVTYYDFRKFDPSKPGLPTSYWMRISPAGGTNFGPDINVAGAPFNMLKAPDAGGRFLGDYEGLAARGNKFVALYCVATNRAHNRSDCYVAQVKP